MVNGRPISLLDTLGEEDDWPVPKDKGSESLGLSRSPPISAEGDVAGFPTPYILRILREREEERLLSEQSAQDLLRASKKTDQPWWSEMPPTSAASTGSQPSTTPAKPRGALVWLGGVAPWLVERGWPPMQAASLRFDNMCVKLCNEQMPAALYDTYMAKAAKLESEAGAEADLWHRQYCIEVVNRTGTPETRAAAGEFVPFENRPKDLEGLVSVMTALLYTEYEALSRITEPRPAGALVLDVIWNACPCKDPNAREHAWKKLGSVEVTMQALHLE
jgi:hypothetical protein